MKRSLYRKQQEAAVLLQSTVRRMQERSRFLQVSTLSKLLSWALCRVPMQQVSIACEPCKSISQQARHDSADACAAQAGGNLHPEIAARPCCASGHSTACSCGDSGAEMLAWMQAETHIPAHASSCSEAAVGRALLAASRQVPPSQECCSHCSGLIPI